MIKKNDADFKIPNVIWFQTFEKVILRIDEFDLLPNKVAIEIFFKKMSFRCETKDGRKIKFEIDFFSDVMKEIIIDKKERWLKLLVSKKENQYWPRLTREKESFSWIKLDYHNFNEEDEDDAIIDTQGGEFDFETKPSVLSEINYASEEMVNKQNEINKLLTPYF